MTLILTTKAQYSITGNAIAELLRALPHELKENECSSSDSKESSCERNSYSGS